MFGIICVAAALFIIVYVVALNVYFARTNPAAALLEGAQFVQYQQLMAAKGMPVIEPSPPIPAPSRLSAQNRSSLPQGNEK